MALELLLAWLTLAAAALVYLRAHSLHRKTPTAPAQPVQQPPAAPEKPAGPALAWVARGQEGTLSYAADVRGCQARLGRNTAWAPSMWLLVHGAQVWHLRGETPAQAQVVAEAILQREPLCLYVCQQAPRVQ